LLLVSWNIFVFEFVRFYYYTLFCFSIFCCLKNRRNNRFVFFFLQGTLTVALAGRWGLEFTSSGLLQRADAVNGETERCSGRPGARPPRPGRGRAARRRRALLRPSALIDRQVQGRVVCSMKACARASKVFWFIGAGMIYSTTDQRMLNWTPCHDRLTAGAG
jgi:hypothetical protein